MSTALRFCFIQSLVFMSTALHFCFWECLCRLRFVFFNPVLSVYVDCALFLFLGVFMSTALRFRFIQSLVFMSTALRLCFWE